MAMAGTNIMKHASHCFHLQVTSYLCIALYGYVGLSVLYTSNFLLYPLAISALERLPANSSYASIFSTEFNSKRIDVNQPESRSHPVSSTKSSTFAPNLVKGVIDWVPQHGLFSRVFNSRQAADTNTNASVFFSKAFSLSQEHLTFGDQPNLEIIPYYYRASSSFHAEDVTITTLVTQNRFTVFKQLVEKYRGPISVTIHVSRAELAAGSRDSFLDSLHRLYTSTPLMPLYVDMHLVMTPSVNDRQFNTWRNVARMFARTDYVMMLDVDFVPCTNFRKRIRNMKDGKVRELLRNGDAALVIPAFEYVKHNEGMDAEMFPRRKDTLIELYNSSRIEMFHSSWAPGHNSSDYPRFLFHSRPGEVYKVTSENYQHAYEPYVIFRKEGSGKGIPWCDERFVGYGGNKAACLFEMYLSGVSFYVLSDDFLIHQSHAYDEHARKLERRYNRKIYADFREEICLKYLKAFLDSGTLDSPKAHNVREECKKIKSIAKIAAMKASGRPVVFYDDERMAGESNTKG